MKKVYNKCRGVDVCKNVVVPCFMNGMEKELRTFGTTTRELLEMADRLTARECEVVSMESTATYWKLLYNVLESSGLESHGGQHTPYEGSTRPENRCQGRRLDSG